MRVRELGGDFASYRESRRESLARPASYRRAYKAKSITRSIRPGVRSAAITAPIKGKRRELSPVCAARATRQIFKRVKLQLPTGGRPRVEKAEEADAITPDDGGGGKDDDGGAMVVATVRKIADAPRIYYGD